MPDISITFEESAPLAIAFPHSVPVPSGAGSVAAADITDATAAGRAVLTAANAAAQRTALGLQGAAVLAVGTTAGTVAAGDDARFSSGSAMTLVARSGTSIGVGPSSVAETDVLNLDIPANTCTADGGSVEAVGFGRALNTSGSSRTLALKIYVGGTKVIDSSMSNILTSALARPMRWMLHVVRTGATTAELLLMHQTMASAPAGPNAGYGDMNVAATLRLMAATSVAWTWASATALRVTLAWDLSHASVEYSQKGYRVTAIP